MAKNAYPALRTARRWIVAMVGVTIAAIGVALLVLPGPGLLVIALGVGVLASEFAWARHLLRRVRAQLPGADAKNPPPRDSEPESDGR